jgi:hypothetical protein
MCFSGVSMISMYLLYRYKKELISHMLITFLQDNITFHRDISTWLCMFFYVV